MIIRNSAGFVVWDDEEDALKCDDFMGEGLRQRRKKAGLTIVELSKRSGVPVSTIKKYEGNHSEPGIRNAVAIENVLRMSLNDD